MVLQNQSTKETDHEASLRIDHGTFYPLLVFFMQEATRIGEAEEKVQPALPEVARQRKLAVAKW